MESAETVLPEPDSPTSAVVSPWVMSKETPLTASTTLPPLLNLTDRSRTSTSGSAKAIGSPEGLARVERIAHALADENEDAQQPRDRGEGGEAQPRRLQVGLALGQQLAEV